jgi:hypothetical protein
MTMANVRVPATSAPTKAWPIRSADAEALNSVGTVFGGFGLGWIFSLRALRLAGYFCLLCLIKQIYLSFVPGY